MLKITNFIKGLLIIDDNIAYILVSNKYDIGECYLEIFIGKVIYWSCKSF